MQLFEGLIHFTQVSGLRLHPLFQGRDLHPRVPMFKQIKSNVRYNLRMLEKLGLEENDLSLFQTVESPIDIEQTLLMGCHRYMSSMFQS